MKMVFILILAVPFLIWGCGPNDRNLPYTPVGQRTVALNMTNYWEFLNVNIVEVNPDVGTLLQIFSENNGAVFSGVIITYSVFPTDNHQKPHNLVLMLPSGGAAQTTPCTQAFPRIIDIVGTVRVGG